MKQQLLVHQVTVLLYKNFRLRRTSLKSLLAELAAPIIVTCLFIAFSSIAWSNLPTSNFKFQPVPSVDTFFTTTDGSETQVLYTPAGHPEVESMVAKMRTFLNTTKNGKLTVDPFVGFENETTLESYRNSSLTTTLAGIVFTMDQSSNNSFFLNYTIRMPQNMLPNPSTIIGVAPSGSAYSSSGFLQLQMMVDNAFVASKRNAEIPLHNNLNISGYPALPVEVKAAEAGARDGVLKNISGIFMTLAFSVTFFILISDLVHEKETKIRETMKMVGMLDSAYWISWYLTTQAIYMLPLLVCVGIVTGSDRLFINADYGVVFFMYLFYVLSVTPIAFIMSIFFNKARVGGIFGLCVLLALAAMGTVLSQYNNIRGLQYLTFLFSPIAFQYGHVVMTFYENELTNPGLSWSNSHIAPPELPSMAGVICMIIFDSILYIVLAWYLNQVIAGEYGVAKPYNFVLKRSYWFKASEENKILLQPPPTAETQLSNINEEDPDAPLIREARHSAQNPVIQIGQLRKEFDTTEGTYIAVKGLSMDLYQNELLSLLGRNGAGKSTLISMLTGLIAPTSGDASIFGHRISSDLFEIRKVLGVCPQHNIIWEKLSVRDHLIVYAGLKGTQLKASKEMVDSMIEDLKLSEKADQWASQLSGGQKRRLCVGMAFIAGSKVVFLDEPTSGLDPSSRRAIWDLVKRNKEGRVIILTTHFMDEADYLGDRIAVINSGFLRAEGSSLFLKSKFGAGYTLTLVKEDHADSENIAQLVLDTIPEASVLSNVAKEISFRLPKKTSSSFPALLSKLETTKSKIGIESYGISVTTLDEVFMSITASKKTQENETEKTFQQLEVIKSEGHGSSLFTQIRTIFNKRFLMSSRDWKLVLVQVIVPLLVIIVAVGMRAGLQFFVGIKFNDSLNPVNLSALTNETLYVPYVGDETAQELPLYGSSKWMWDHFDTRSQMVKFMISGDNKSLLPGGILITDLSTVTGQYGLQLVYNTDHSLPRFLNMFDNAFFNQMSNMTESSSQRYEIYTYSRPWLGKDSNFFARLGSVLVDILFLGLVIIAYSIVPSSSSVPLILERETGVKQLQLISGAGKFAYWMANLLWDLALVVPTLLLTCVIFYIGDTTSFGGEAFGITLFVLLLYILDSTLLTYLLSTMWTKHVKAQVIIFFIYFASGFGFLAAILAPLMIFGSNSIIIVIMGFCMSILCPQFAMARALMVMIDFVQYRHGLTIGELTTAVNIPDYGYFDRNMLGIPLAAMAIHVGLFFIALLIVEYKPEITGFLRRAKCTKDVTQNVQLSEHEDEDVRRERQLLATLDPSHSMIHINQLKKVWDDKNVAVDGLCLSIPKHQCFGLLGENGAGKTTTINILCGYTAPTSGTAFLNQFNIVTETAGVRKSLGYCPQFDALIDTMTARQHLEMYAALKGIPRKEIPEVVNAFIALMRIEEYADKLTKGYSGGNKRKLSLAIALIANPPILFLDEPTTGMDPVSRRFMWNLISEISKDRAIILTSHFMEECDALCTRIGIMNKGKLKCLGSSQHLKSRFGKGYTVEIKTKPSSNAQSPDTILYSTFPGAQLIEHHDTVYRYEIPQHNLSTAVVFQELEKHQDEWEDYSVTQTTLEQIFLKMSKADDDVIIDVN